MSASLECDRTHNTEVLSHLYGQMHEYIRHNEEMENKVAFAVSGLLLAFSGLILRSSFGAMTNLERLFITGFISVSTALALVFLSMNHATLLWQRKTVVRVEHLFGFYQPDHFKKAAAFELSTYPGGDSMRTVLPPKGAEWGNLSLTNRSSILPHFLGLLFSCAAAIVTLWVVPVAPQPTNGVPTVSGAVGQHVASSPELHIPDHLELTLRQPDIAQTPKPTLDQSMANRVSSLENTVRELVKGRDQPTPPSAKVFQLHFGNGAHLDDLKARQTIDDAVSRAKTATAVFCNGYSDKTGDETAAGQVSNLKISSERANFVADELVRNGVPREKITVNGAGTLKPERMVEIVIE